MFKENVYCLIHNKRHWYAVNNAFGKLGYTPLPFFHSRAKYIRTNTDGTLSYGNNDTFDKYCKGYKEVVLNDKNELVMNNQSKQCVSLTLEDARKLYASGEQNFKTIALGAFSREELEGKELPKSWDELKRIKGYWITNPATIEYSDRHNPCYSRRNIFATRKQAQSAIAYAQLTQLMKVYNDDEEFDWKYNSKAKFCIVRIGNQIGKYDHSVNCYNPIAFKSKDLRDEFFDNFQDLLKEYFMIDYIKEK